MRITRLSASNFKGRSFDHDLAPVTLFVGRNFAGKSARVEALVLALAAYLPGVEKTGKGLFERLASGNPMKVVVNRDNSVMTERKWTEQRGTVSYKGIMDDINLPPVAIDATEYLLLSAVERVKFLFARAKLPPELSVRGVSETLRVNLKNIKLEEHTAAAEAFIDELVNSISIPPVAGLLLSVQDWIENLLATTKDSKLEADRNVRRMEAHCQGLTQLRSSDAAPPDAERRLAEARKELEVADAAAATVKEAGRQMAADLEQCERLAAESVDLVSVKMRLEENAKAQVVAKAVKPAGPPPESAQHAANVPSTTVERNALDAAVKEANKVNTIYQTFLGDVKRIEAAMEAAAAQHTCPACGQSTVEVQKQVIANHRKSLKAAKQNAESCFKIYNAAAKIESEASEALNEAEKFCKDYAVDLAERQDKYQTAFAAWRAKSDAYTAAQRRLLELHEEANVLRSKLTDKEASKAVERLPKLRADLEAKRADYAVALAVATAKRGAVADADAQYKRIVAERGEAASRAKAVEERDKAKAEASVLKEFLALLGALQSRLVDAAIGPVIARCNELCGGILRAPLEYRDGEIGFAVPTGFVTHRTMSGTERALCYCAVSVALAADAPLRLVVLDELGRLDLENKSKLFSAVCGLEKAGKIDQAVLVDTVAPPMQPFDNFKVIQL